MSEKLSNTPGRNCPNRRIWFRTQLSLTTHEFVQSWFIEWIDQQELTMLPLLQIICSKLEIACLILPFPNCHWKFKSKVFVKAKYLNQPDFCFTYSKILYSWFNPFFIRYKISINESCRKTDYWFCWYETITCTYFSQKAYTTTRILLDFNY